jgi:hypothetical protein
MISTLTLTDDEKQNILIIGICGGKNNGKDTIGNYLKNNIGAIRLAFGEPLKKGIQQFFDLTDEQLNDEHEKEKIDTFWNHAPREFFQVFGTEVCQYFLPTKLINMDKNIWVKNVERRIARLYRKRPNIYNVFVITDLRFEHEEAFIRSFNHNIIIQVNRTINNKVFNTHISETTLNILQPNYIIENNKSINTLHNVLDLIIKNNKIKKISYYTKIKFIITKYYDNII